MDWMDTLATTLARLTLRERGMLVALVLLVIPVGLIWGIATPLTEGRDAALARLEETRALQAWVRARRADLPPEVSEAPPATAPIGISGIEASLVTAGLRDSVAVLSNSGNGGVSLRFDAVAFSRLMPWLDQTEAAAGYALTSFRLLAGETPDVVLADLQLDPRQ